MQQTQEQTNEYGVFYPFFITLISPNAGSEAHVAAVCQQMIDATERFINSNRKHLTHATSFDVSSKNKSLLIIPDFYLFEREIVISLKYFTIKSTEGLGDDIPSYMDASKAKVYRYGLINAASFIAFKYEDEHKEDKVRLRVSGCWGDYFRGDNSQTFQGGSLLRIWDCCKFIESNDGISKNNTH